MTVLQVSYAILLAVGVGAALLAVPHYVRSSWRVRDRDARALAAALHARRAGTWGALPSRDHGFALHHVLIAWATALVADLAASAAFGEIESIRLVAGRALVGGGAAVSIRYVLAYVGSPATRPTWLRREQVSYALAALFGVLGGLTGA